MPDDKEPPRPIPPKRGKAPAAPDSTEVVELAPNAWEQFERAVDQVLKSPPQHKKNREKKER